jgi:hypothetical protein
MVAVRSAQHKSSSITFSDIFCEIISNVIVSLLFCVPRSARAYSRELAGIRIVGFKLFVHKLLRLSSTRTAPAPAGFYNRNKKNINL